jgi:hypothetical protein
VSHSNFHVLVDANILALWIVGQVSEDQVPKCRRTRHYSVLDYRILVEYLTRYTDIVTTPNIGTETSNLLGALSGKYLEKARLILSRGIMVWNEIYVKSLKAVQAPEYLRLGLTDSAILLAANSNIEVLTDDLDLYLALESRRIPVKNFTHLRAFQSDSFDG